MFDSVDYFLRNKIKVIYEYHSSWYYGLPLEYVKSSFDKKSKTFRLDSIKFNDPTSPIAKNFKIGGINNFVLRDTVTTRQDGFKDTLKYFFDNKKRLKQKAHISWLLKQGNFISSNPKDLVRHVTTWTYIYEDSNSKKLKSVVTESPYFIDTKNFYYCKLLLSTRTSLDSNKIDHKITFETMSYDYYSDNKLKRQTRRVTSDHCPTICEGTIEYKYETD